VYHGIGNVFVPERNSLKEQLGKPSGSPLHEVKLTKDDVPGLTQEEREILDHLVEAFSKFSALGQKHPSDNSEFQYAIHLAQQKVGMRVARRVNPDFWWRPTD
jgi:hypothetical protein